MIDTDGQKQSADSGNAVCPLCHASDACRKTEDNPTFGVPIPVCYCSRCELFFSERIPDELALDEFYRTSYFADSQQSGLRYALKKWFAKCRAVSQHRYLYTAAGAAAGRSALEAGCADATFLAVLAKHGWKVRGLEYNEFMIAQALSRHGLTLEQRDIMSLDPSEDVFDCIVLLHVLEHMSDPQKVLVHVRKLLRPGGVLFLELPHSPEPDDVDSGVLDFYLSTTHLYNFRPHSFSLLIEQAGFHVERMDRFFYPVPALLNASSREVGRILMNGALHTYHPMHLTALFLTLGALTIRRSSVKDPLQHIPLDAPWQGVGDSIRLIAR